MRPLYFILWFAVTFGFRLFFRRHHEVRPSKKRFGRTIFVSNHPSSFLDPLVVSCLRKPVVFFMTRSDVFNRITRPIFWLAHMLPIYRQQDGENSQEKNKKVFKMATKALASKRNLLIFGEGITDDSFERRLKPIKKGAVRIGFTALEDLDWSVDIQVQGIGINYTNPEVLRSEVLVAAAEPIVLNEFKEAYLDNPSRVIADLNRELEQRMQAQITHVQSDEHIGLHEQIMMLTRKGMHVACYEQHLSLEDRWNYSVNLANHLNNLSEQQNQTLRLLVKEHFVPYFLQLSKIGLSEQELYWFAIDINWRYRTVLKLLLQFPFFLLGMLHVALPHLLVKRFVESRFKRQVFWSSSKLALLLVILPLWNIFIINKLSNYIALEWYLWALYFVFLNFVALAYYLFIKNAILFKKYWSCDAQILKTIVKNRKEVLLQIDTTLYNGRNS